MPWEKILKGDNLPKGPHQNDDVPEEAFEKVMDIFEEANREISAHAQFGDMHIAHMGLKKWLDNLIGELQGVYKIKGTTSGFDSKFQDLNKSD